MLNRFLVNIVKPLTGKSLSYVKDSSHLVESIQGAPIHKKSYGNFECNDVVPFSNLQAMLVLFPLSLSPYYPA